MDRNDEPQGASSSLVLTFVVLALASSVGLVVAITMSYEHVQNTMNEPSPYEKALRPYIECREKAEPPESTNPADAFPVP